MLEQISIEIRELRTLLEVGAHQAFIVRGCLRSMLLNELRPWDDIDVVTTHSQSKLAAMVGDLALRRTMHGGFKLQLTNSARTADIWTIDSTMGVQCASLSGALELFEFTVDAIAMDLESLEIVDPLGNLADLDDRKIDLQPLYKPPDEFSFAIVKGTYLALRHNLSIGPRLAARFAEAPISIAPWVLTKLQTELSRMNIEGSERRLRIQTPAANAVIDILLGGI